MSSNEESLDGGNFLAMIATAVAVVGIIALCFGTAHHVSKKMLFLKFVSWVFLVPYYDPSGYDKFSAFLVAWILYVVGFALWLWVAKSFVRGRWQETYQPSLDTFRFWWLMPFPPIIIVLVMFFFASNGWLGLTPWLVRNCASCGILTAWSLAHSVGHMMQPLVYLPQLWLLRNVYKKKDPATYQGSPVKANVRLYLLSVLVVCIMTVVIDLVYQYYAYQVTVIAYGLTALLLATPWILRTICRAETGYFVKAGEGKFSPTGVDALPGKNDLEMNGLPTPVDSVVSDSTPTASVGVADVSNKQEQSPSSGPNWSNIEAGPLPNGSLTTEEPPSKKKISLNPFAKRQQKQSGDAVAESLTATVTQNTSQDWDTSWLT